MRPKEREYFYLEYLNDILFLQALNISSQLASFKFYNASIKQKICLDLRQIRFRSKVSKDQLNENDCLINIMTIISLFRYDCCQFQRVYVSKNPIDFLIE